MQKIVILYEESQAEAVDQYAQDADALIIALSLDVEMALAKRGIAYLSGRAYKHTDPKQFENEDAIITAFFADPRWESFAYRGVSLKTVWLFMFRAYLQQVWYYSNLLISILEAHTDAAEVILFAPKGGFVPEVAGALASRELSAVIDCAKLISEARGVTVTVMPPAAHSSSFFQSSFILRRTFFGLFLSLWNTAIRLFVRPRRPRLLVSDYWHNVGSTLERLEEAECLFLDRAEIRHIPWRSLLRYRMRFVHIRQFVSSSARRRAKEQSRLFALSWDALRDTLPATALCRGHALDPLLHSAIDVLIERSEKTLCEIEGVYALYDRLRPDLVLLRASVSAQTHFSILPLVAKEKGIPSLELQHGLEYLGVGSISREHTAAYLGVYGSLIKKELMSLGYTSDRVREVGSPRFDAYRSARREEAGPFTILAIAPDVRPYDIYDTYRAEEYLTALAGSIETIPSAHLILKLRSGPAGERFFRAVAARVFSQVSYTIAQREGLGGLFKDADAVVSPYSTAILEALQCGMPLIISALNPLEGRMILSHFAPYATAGALRVATTSEELRATLAELAANPLKRAEMSKCAQQFMAEHFSFDGHASERCASLITECLRLSLINNQIA